MEKGQIFKSSLTLKNVRSTKWIKQAKIACCNAYACFETSKHMLKKALENHFNKVTQNVTLSEVEFKKFCELCDSIGFNVEILDVELNVVKKVDVFINVD